MRRLVVLLLAIVVFACALPIGAIADELPENIFGVYTLTDENADYVALGEEKFYSQTEFDVLLKLTVSGCESKFDTVYVNGTSIGVLKDGENNLTFSSKLLTEGKNLISVLLGAGTVVYSDKMIYGKVNLDDMVIVSAECAFVGGKYVAPDGIVAFMPIVGKAGYTEKEIAYSQNLSIGDGWHADTGMGGSTPSTPLGAALVFSDVKLNGVFAVDTTTVADGEYEMAVCGKDGSVLSKKSVIVDNTAPVISIEGVAGSKLSASDVFKINIIDSSDYTVTTKLDDKQKDLFGKDLSCSGFGIGRHILYILSVDANGNSSEYTYVFEVAESKPQYSFTKNGNAVTLTTQGDTTYYSAELLNNINAYANPNGSFNMSALRSSDEYLIPIDGTAVTKANGNTLPYQSFVAETNKASGQAVISYCGETGSGDDILLKAWNYKNSCWDTVSKQKSGVEGSVVIELADYSKDGKIRINAMPYILSNGSDTILWNSDTQYYSRFEDLYYHYKAIADYAVEQYNAGNIGYTVHTGDLVDQTQAGDAEANKEMSFASSMQKILDDAKVPNGVVSGNHDIQHSTANYEYFAKYFGADRYKDFEWYGGEYGDNTHHYDLITIGSYDFLFMYIGDYYEDKPETIAWANSVLKAYPNRNAVICTHEFINPAGDFTSNRAETMFNSIVVPNENVKMVLCGHVEGICDKLFPVGDSGRQVLAILADYQFSELGVDPQHNENNMPLDGEGFVRLMTFSDAGQLISTTYSPSNKMYNFFPSYQDSFIYNLDLIKSERSIKTTSINIGVNIKELGKFGETDWNLKGIDAAFAKINCFGKETVTELLVLNGDKNLYEVEPHTDEVITPVTVKEEGMRGVSGSLRRGEVNSIPEAALVKQIENLLPADISGFRRTSGSSMYQLTPEGTGYKMIHEYVSYTWTTLQAEVNKVVNVGENTRLYFGVTSDKQTKWNLVVSIGDKVLNFSQELYSLFGYVNSVPSDIQGTWQGYIDLADYVTGEVNVRNINIVTANAGHAAVFDYLFIGEPQGKTLTFKTNEDIEYKTDVLAGSAVDAPSIPFINGYVFDGWYTSAEGGDKVEFPYTVNENTELFARFSVDTNEDKAEYFDIEVDIISEKSISVIDIVLIVIIALDLIVLVAIIIKNKKPIKPVIKGE